MFALTNSLWRQISKSWRCGACNRNTNRYAARTLVAIGRKSIACCGIGIDNSGIPSAYNAIIGGRRECGRVLFALTNARNGIKSRNGGRSNGNAETYATRTLIAVWRKGIIGGGIGIDDRRTPCSSDAIIGNCWQSGWIGAALTNIGNSIESWNSRRANGNTNCYTVRTLIAVWRKSIACGSISINSGRIPRAYDTIIGGGWQGRRVAFTLTNARNGIKSRCCGCANRNINGQAVGALPCGGRKSITTRSIGIDDRRTPCSSDAIIGSRGQGGRIGFSLTY